MPITRVALLIAALLLFLVASLKEMAGNHRLKIDLTALGLALLALALLLEVRS